MTNEPIIFFLRFAGRVGMELCCIALSERVEAAQQEAERLGKQLAEVRKIGETVLRWVDCAASGAPAVADAEPAPEAEVEAEPELEPEPAPEADAVGERGPALHARRERLAEAVKEGDWRRFAALLTDKEAADLCMEVIALRRSPCVQARHQHED